jgi:hypothetical protein
MMKFEGDMMANGTVTKAMGWKNWTDKFQQKQQTFLSLSRTSTLALEPNSLQIQ